ncbi:Transposase [Crocosphaera watsonii WH 0005]|uniref:Transposase n=1 Tax=Crocosphaera watsonii WH 0005 TaxID=423472 RepID=T2IRU5_CROWT|nr:Transposase [Crocosphaera watsonii WH 0005]
MRGLEISDHFSKSISLSKKTVQIVYLDDASEVIKYYKMRGGIEAMFRDYKSGGYSNQ